MAFTSSKTGRSVAGSLVVETHSWSAASVTSGTISTGLGTILHVSLNNDVTEGDGLAVPSGQSVAISSVTSNDTGTIMVIGY